MRVKLLSSIYVSIRFVLTKCLYLIQFIFLKNKNLEPAVVVGDKILSSFSIFGKIIYDFKIPKHLEIEIYNLIFPSPIVGASFKSEKNILEMWLRMGIGGLIFKTIMQNPQNGNPEPRLQDVIINGEKGILNSLGLPGPGVEKFITLLKKSKVWNYNRPIGISIGGHDKTEYINNIKLIDESIKEYNDKYFYELNISCPNTKNGKTITEDLSTLETILQETKKMTNKVISVKVTPDASDQTLKNIGEICSSFDHILINAGNTQYKTPEDVGINPLNFSMPGGGLSGPFLFKRTLEMVSLFSQFQLPIMATGGISSIHHIRQARALGASLFGMATSLVLDPYCIPNMNSKL